MKNSNSTNSYSSSEATSPQNVGFSPWQQLKRKRISYFTVPLIVMATLTEFVILATGWKYQQTVCLPKGMGVTFFGIGPIGATILAVELLKLPLAVWTASRHGKQKAFMLLVGLPLICVLTFQLVKDMAVYEMGVAMTPASQLFEKASAEEVKINQLNGELAAIEQKKTDREHKLAELAARKAKAKADLDESLKHNETKRQDAISLTDYQKNELTEVQTRQANIIKQFDSDTAQLTKAIADLRAQRETEVGRATEWNAEEARIENAYKAKLAEYTNQKAAYEKAKAEYDGANFLRRQLMREPVSPGVPPEREVNKLLKPTLITELEAQIKAKEAELAEVNNKRRERVAQVEADARRVREQFDARSTSKREESDRKRDEMLAAYTALAATLTAEEKQIDQEFQSTAQKVDGIRAEIDACRKRAEEFYEAREAAIKNTQVHRIATTVEIVRGLVMGQRPVSIKATAKERGDLYTDQISMVRIWVYPVLAFLVAFLPTLMVEVGFSTIFRPEQQRPPHRLGFFGRRMHWLYTRAGRLKVLRAERVAREATAKIAARDNALAAVEQKLTAEKAAAERALTAANATAQQALAAANAAAEQALAGKENELRAARETIDADTTRYEEESKRKAIEHEEQLQRSEEEHKSQLKKKEQEWVAKFTDLADSLNRAVQEKDALRDLQRSEVERQIQMRQNAWSDRLTQMRQELDDQRTAFEAERTALMQEHQKRLMEVTEDSKTQVIQARRQMADAELAAVEKAAKLEHDLKEALYARDTAESQLKQQADALSRQLSQAQEDAAREIEKTARQEKHRLERQRLEFEKTLRQREEGSEHRMKQREQELTLAFDARLMEEKAKVEQSARETKVELERQFEARAREVDARWKQEVQQREEAAQIRLKQREQQLQAQFEVHSRDEQAHAEEELRRRESQFEHQLQTQSREAEARLRNELQQQELAFHAKLKQREQEWTNKAAAREAELQNQWAAEARARQEEWEHQTESRVRAAETRQDQEAQQKDEVYQLKLRQREQELQAQFDARQAELRTQWDQELRRHDQELERKAEARIRAAETRLTHETHQKDEMYQLKLRQQEQQLQAQFDARQAELRAQRDQELQSQQQELERKAEARARATESRWMAELQQKEELFQSKLRQRDEQWQAKLDSARAELQMQAEQDLRRREAESAEESQQALQELEAKLRQEMKQHDEAAQARARQREQEFAAQLAEQAEAHQTARVQWETEVEHRSRSTTDHFKALLDRTEKERDEAKEFAADGYRQVKKLEKKLSEASAFLNGLQNGNGKHVVGSRD